MLFKRKQIDYKWVILVVCFLMEFITLGFCSSNAGLYTVPITKALNIPRSLYSISTSIRYAVQTITALSFGAVIQKTGTRKAAFMGMLSMVGSVVIRIYATTFYHFYFSSALWGFGIVFSGGTMAGTIVRKWFHKDIGKYTGIVMSANGLGGAIAAQIISPIINSGAVFGYRDAYKLSAVITLIFTIIVVIFLRDKPSCQNLPVSNTKKKPRGVTWSGPDYDIIKRKPYFYLTALMIFLTGISLQSVGNVSIAHRTDIGLSSSFIAITATLASICLMFSKIGVGILYDKRGLRFTLLTCHIACLINFVIHALLKNTAIGMAATIFAVFCSSLAMPLETVMIPLISSDLFGINAYSKVLGMYMAANSLGLCLGAPIGDIWHDLTGSYVPCYWFFSGLTVVIAICFQFVIRTANRDKEKHLTEQNVTAQQSTNA